MMLDDDLRAYLNVTTTRCPKIREIWLIGSRANGTARAESDWDFIMFADSGALDLLRRDQALHRNDVDLLVVDDNTGEFAKP